MTHDVGERLVASAATLAFPRRSGSEGDRRVIEELSARLEGLGLHVAVEDFSYELAPVERILRWTLLGGAGLVVWAGWLAHSSPIWSGAAIVVLVLSGGILLGWSPWLEGLYRRSGPTRTANVVGKREAAGPGRRLILMAHHDSKSQSLALPARMGATLGALLGVVGVVVGAGVVLAGRGDGLSWMGVTAGVVAGVSMVALAAMSSGNDSPGGVDNAGSLAIVLELAARLRELPPDVELVVLFTGAEEDHMVGAMRWLDLHAEELESVTSDCFNFDGAGSPGRVVLITRYGIGRAFAPDLERMTVTAAREMGTPIRRIVMAPAVGIDAIPFAHRGIECLSFSSGSLGQATYAVHSAGDVAGNLDGDTMARIVDLAEAAVHRWVAGSG